MSTPKSEYQLLQDENAELRKVLESFRGILARNGIKVSANAIPKLSTVSTPEKEKVFSDYSGGELTNLYQTNRAKYNRLKYRLD